MDIYRVERNFARAIERVHEADIIEINKEHILKYKDYSLATGVGKQKVMKWLDFLRGWAGWFGRDFNAVTKEDVIRVVANNVERFPSVWTKRDYRYCLKAFFKWLKDEEKPPETAWMKLYIPKSKLPIKKISEIPTEEQVFEMVAKAKHPLDAALIATEYDLGSRPGGPGKMTWGDVTTDEFGFVYNYQDKMGPNTRRAILSISYMHIWKQAYPFQPVRDEYPVWVQYRAKDPLEDYMRYDSFDNIIRDLSTRLFGKAFSLYDLRHARITTTSHFMSDAEQCEAYGWVQGSKMARIYRHLSGAVDEKLLEFYNMKQKKKDFMRPKQCPKCQAWNSPTMEQCHRCSEPVVSVKRITDMDVHEKLLRFLVENPDVYEGLMRRG